MTELGLSGAEHARLNGFMVDIASAARGTPIADGAGNYRFGGKGSLCIYPTGQFHDFSGGAREHGHSALELVAHLYPNEDATVWARAWLACHPGVGAFVPGESDEPADDHPEIEAMTFVERLYQGAQPIDDTPGHTYLTQTRGLPLRPEDQAQLRFIPTYRGDEGALLASGHRRRRQARQTAGDSYCSRRLQVEARAGPHHDSRRKKAWSLSSRIAEYEGDRDGRN